MRSSNKDSKQKLYPNFVTGFVDGEASFRIKIRKNKATKTGWSIQACFAIGLHSKDLDLLKSI
jgi:hypothetical protein